MAFIRLRSGRIINTNQILWIDAPDPPRGRVTIRMTDEHDITLTSTSIKEIEAALRAVSKYHDVRKEKV